MQHGSLKILLLSLALIFGDVIAQEMAPNTRQRWLQDEFVLEKSEQLLNFAEKGQIDSLRLAMGELSLAQQEATIFLVLQKIENENIVMTEKLAKLIKDISLIPPTYQTSVRENGFVKTHPAFAYPAIAKRLSRKWEYEQKTNNLILAVERGELKLEKWLNEGSALEIEEKELLLVTEMDGLSPPALTFLADQIVESESKVVFWLPDLTIVERLHSLSQDSRLEATLVRLRSESE